MKNTIINREEIYECIDGITVLKEVIENEVETLTNDEIIAEKEAEMLLMYKEIQSLKAI